MASAMSLLSEKQFLCSLCRDVFSKPVTVPCGHSFCMACIERHWKSSGAYQCPLCKKRFKEKPDLSVNRLLAEITEEFKKTRMVKSVAASEKDPPVPQIKKAQLGKILAEHQQKVQDRMKKLEEISQCRKLMKDSAEREIEESKQVFAALLCSLERSQAELIELIEQKRREAEWKAEGLIAELEKEIWELQSRSVELEQLVQTEDQTEFLQRSASLSSPPYIKNWSDITVLADPSLGAGRKAVTNLVKKCQEEVQKLTDIELKRIQQYSDGVTLDPNTAHPYLIISQDGKKVRLGTKRQAVPDNSKRFDHVANVLGKQFFTSGRHYWEVDVGEKTEWDLGVAKQSIDRKGKITVSPENGYWSMCLRNGNQYTANNATSTPLLLQPKPWKVGVYVDYEEGQVSFYNVETRTHIYTFMDTFTEKLRAFFGPGLHHDGKNSAPLIISPAIHKSWETELV